MCGFARARRYHRPLNRNLRLAREVIKEKEPFPRIEFFEYAPHFTISFASRKVSLAATDQLLLPLSNAGPIP